MLEDIFYRMFPLSINHSMVFGILLIMGVLGGIFADKIKWLPTISGFMLVGLIIGPESLGIIDKDMLMQASDLVQISLGLILYKLGSSINPKQIIEHPKILLVSCVESFITFLTVFLLLSFFDISPIVSALVAAISISSSPAVLIHVANEMGAKGIITENSKTLVALNNLISFLVFTSTLPFALQYTEASWADILGIPSYRMLGGLIIGTGIAYIVVQLSKYLHKTSMHYIFPLLMGGIMLTLGLSKAFEASFLFSILIFGLTIRHFESADHKITGTNFGYGEDIFYIILFVSAGAGLHLNAIYMAGWVALAFPLARCAAKIMSQLSTSRMLGYQYREASATGMLLFPMAGMAIGLMQTTQTYIPSSISIQTSTLVFAAVAILETFGPPIAKWAFIISGEAPDFKNHKALNHQSEVANPDIAEPILDKQN